MLLMLKKNDETFQGCPQTDPICEDLKTYPSEIPAREIAVIAGASKNYSSPGMVLKCHEVTLL